VFKHEAFGGKYIPREVLFNLEPGVIGAVTRDRRCNSKSPLGHLFSPENLVDHTRRQKLGQRPLQNSSDPPL
jgi:hypothetical protein